MNYFKNFYIALIPLVFLTQKCQFTNFYPDPDNSGLSRFTSRGYNVASVYINGKAFSQLGARSLRFYKDSSGNLTDTLHFSLRLLLNDSLNLDEKPQYLSFQVPVPHSFNINNLLAFNGQRFENSVPVSLINFSNTSFGTSTLYFVSVTEIASPSDEKYVKLSGLFDGKIGDSILLTKGRFDFQIAEKDLNF